MGNWQIYRGIRLIKFLVPSRGQLIHLSFDQIPCELWILEKKIQGSRNVHNNFWLGMVVFGIVGNFEQEKVVTNRIDGAENNSVKHKTNTDTFYICIIIIKNK